MSYTMIVVIIVLVVSGLAGWLFSRSKEVEMPVKVMIFVLYFWLLVFVQIIIFAGLYHFNLLPDIF